MFAASMRTLISPPLFSLHLLKPSLLSTALRAHSSSVSHRKLHTDAASKSFAGEIHVVFGPMFSGKTTTLLRRILAEKEIGKKIAVIKSDKDTRYCADRVDSESRRREVPLLVSPRSIVFQREIRFRCVQESVGRDRDRRGAVLRGSPRVLPRGRRRGGEDGDRGGIGRGLSEEEGFVYVEEDGGESDGVDRWSGCVYACVSESLCERSRRFGDRSSRFGFFPTKRNARCSSDRFV
ncbi:unnamed protein product [Brassica napus]|uniref:Thymidine kinase n=1 Tax=Brassica napus TaxID=3708 RepID=A0A816IZC0_BRANA|nr:unnamed protein product [Brassica napus]